MGDTIISLVARRSLRQLQGHRNAILAILNNNRDAIQRLFESGVVFHPAGSRAGRDLLLAHELLLRVLDLIDQLAHEDKALTEERRARVAHMQRLLSRASMLTNRTGEKLRTLLPPK